MQYLDFLITVREPGASPVSDPPNSDEYTYQFYVTANSKEEAEKLAENRIFKPVISISVKQVSQYSGSQLQTK